MQLSQKCQYALRALLELRLRRGQGPVPIAQIADAQAIPARFLEQILAELKQAGFVESRRGVQGGYLLAAEASGITIGAVIRLVDGPFDPVKCLSGGEECRLAGEGTCAFFDLWRRARDAFSEVFDSTTIEDIAHDYEANRIQHVPDYTI